MPAVYPRLLLYESNTYIYIYTDRERSSIELWKYGNLSVSGLEDDWPINNDIISYTLFEHVVSRDIHPLSSMFHEVEPTRMPMTEGG